MPEAGNLLENPARPGKGTKSKKKFGHFRDSNAGIVHKLVALRPGLTPEGRILPLDQSAVVVLKIYMSIYAQQAAASSSAHWLSPFSAPVPF